MGEPEVTEGDGFLMVEMPCGILGSIAPDRW